MPSTFYASQSAISKLLLDFTQSTSMSQSAVMGESLILPVFSIEAIEIIEETSLPAGSHLSVNPDQYSTTVGAASGSPSSSITWRSWSG